MLTLRRNICGLAVRNVDVARRDIDVPEKILRHEIVVRRRMFWREADVFVEVERDDAAEIELLLAMQPDQFAIQQ